jgi:hypothetical protein
MAIICINCEMNPLKNPYAPGAGLQPPELAGRDELISAATIAFQRTKRGANARSQILLGLRGVGKTVLLNRLLKIAQDQGLHTAKIEASTNGKLAELLAAELRRILYALDLRKAAGNKVRQAVTVLRNFASAFRITIGEMEFGIEPSPGVADTGRLQKDLPDLFIAVAEAAAERKDAIAIFIDEIQYLSGDELASLVVACHEIAQRGLPLVLIGAGLPQIAALAGNAKSYAERLFDYPAVDRLDPPAARAALTKPAIAAGGAFETAAVEKILEATEGYPYFIQVWGSHVWDAASTSPIRARDVQAITPTIIQYLDRNFFRVRFDRITPLQQKYLRAMAELGPGPHRSSEIASTLGVESSDIGVVRQQLIDKGMVWSPRHGETAFTVPMFDEFMRRQMPTLEKHKPQRRSSKPIRKK